MRSFAVLVLCLCVLSVAKGGDEEESFNMECQDFSNVWSQFKQFKPTCTYDLPPTKFTRVDGSEEPTEYTALAIKFAPKIVAKFFLQLEALMIYDSTLEEITKDDLEPFENLTHFILKNNNYIRSIPGDLFAGTPVLVFVQVEHHFMLDIGADILDPLTNLNSADFSNNYCINYEADNAIQIGILKEKLKKCFTRGDNRKAMAMYVDFYEYAINRSKLLKVQRLIDKNSELERRVKMLSGNFDVLLRKFRGETPSEDLNVNLTCKMARVSICDVEDLVVHVEGSAVENVTIRSNRRKQDGIKEVRIAKQQVLYLPITLGEHFPELTKLAVSSSGLINIDSKAFKNMNKLNSLTLEDNKLQEVPIDAFEHLAKLKSLNLNGNWIEKIPSDSFKGLTNLKRLHLARNQIKTLDQDAFKNVEKLEYLDIHSNALESIDDKTFADLNDLKTLRLNNNKLRSFTAKLSAMPCLEHVDLSRNECINDSADSADEIAKIEASINDKCTG